LEFQCCSLTAEAKKASCASATMCASLAAGTDRYWSSLETPSPPSSPADPTIAESREMLVSRTFIHKTIFDRKLLCKNEFRLAICFTCCDAWVRSKYHIEIFVTLYQIYLTMICCLTEHKQAVEKSVMDKINNKHAIFGVSSQES
jgi:hypothetical protein